MKHSTIVRFLLVSGTVTAFAAGCANNEGRAANQGRDNRAYGSDLAQNRGGHYDSNGVWQGGISQTDRDSTGRTWGTVSTDSRRADAGATEPRSAQGWRDEKGVWRSYDQPNGTSASASASTGYYDSNGQWRATGTTATATTPDANQGAASTRIDRRSERESATADGSRGYYDSNGVWHASGGAVQPLNRSGDRLDPHATAPSGPSTTGTGYDADGVWRSGSAVDTTAGRTGEVRITQGNPNVSTGYYDGNGVWHSVGPAGVVNIPIGIEAERNGRGMRTGTAQDRSGYYDSNGVWRSGRMDDERSQPEANNARSGNRYVERPESDRNGYAAVSRVTTNNEAAAGWPSMPREQVALMTSKYGEPDEMTSSVAVWKNKGGFECIKVFKDEVDHHWPVAHKDFLEHAVAYRVPVDKVGELAKFDGSVLVDITKGCMAAKCDKESHNLLALNLANDICTGKKTAAEARDYFARAVADEKAGKIDPYMEKLTFTPAAAGTAGNPGVKHENGTVNTSKDKDASRPNNATNTGTPGTRDNNNINNNQ